MLKDAKKWLLTCVLCGVEGGGRGVTPPPSDFAFAQAALSNSLRQKVPENLCCRKVPSSAVTVTVTLLNSTVIGGLQGGWNVTVAGTLKSALPFCTGKSPPAAKLCFVRRLRLILAGVDTPHIAGDLREP
jgi:hypothetical protein